MKFQLSDDSNPGILCFPLYFALWLVQKTHPLSRPIRCKSKTNRGFAARVFPHFRQFGRFFLKFSFAFQDIFLSLDWLLWLLWFWFLGHAIERRSIQLKHDSVEWLNFARRVDVLLNKLDHSRSISMRELSPPGFYPHTQWCEKKKVDA